MVRLEIDGREAYVAEGTTIREAARALGIRIPTLCHVPGFAPLASCFVCAVQVEGRPALSPSCAMPVSEGMVVRTDTDDVRATRKVALELLLSDHVGDCVGPCQTGCPARLDIPGFISLLSAEDYRRAAEVVSDDLTLPASLGRICPRLCERRCRRCDVSEPLSIGNLHRFVGDRDRSSPAPYVPRKAPATGRRVAIVGAGPAGLAAAYELLRRGHAAALFDAHSEPGGMLRYGIPAFRLPRRVLEQEVAVVRALGGEFHMETRLGQEVALEDLRRGFDAVLLAVGAQGSRALGCPGEELATPAIAFLESVAEGRPPELGGDVVVVGGGNSALDAARTAVRLGAASVRVLYRRTRREMPCLMSEVEAAEKEGVRIETLVAPARLERIEGGRLRLACSRMALGPPDPSGRPRPIPVPHSELVIEASAVIAALGQLVQAEALAGSGVALTKRGIAADPATLATNLPGVFAGGDGVSGPDVAVRAVAAGRLAAASIDQYLAGRPLRGNPELFVSLMGALGETELAELFREIERVPRVPMPERPVAERILGFEEVELGLHPKDALREGSRCMRCGCGKAPTCELRQLATEYCVDPTRFLGARRSFQRDLSHPEIVYEPGKCILCGACLAVAAEAGAGLGLSFVGRGFETGVAVPLRGSLVEGLPAVARRVAEVCPTGAFAVRGDSCAFSCGALGP